MTHKDNLTKGTTTEKKANPFSTGSPSRRALLLVLLLLVFCGISLFYILMQSQASPALEARIYSDGTLLQTIDLSTVTDAYTFAVDAPSGGTNTIEVRPGAIGICDADCPDRLCVKMGYADSSLLPIICLPHSLVIEVEETEKSQVDGVTY